MIYQNLTVGGTFDHFHKGHRFLLDQAFELGEKVWLGITSDQMCQVSGVKRQVKNYFDRKQEVEKYLQDKGWMGRAVILPIEDKFGTTLIDRNLQVIVVSPETKKTAVEINQRRLQKNWPELKIITVLWVLADDSNPINSQRIRDGEIDREGRIYKLPENWGMRRLPENLREEFKKPLGKLVKSISDLSYLSHLESYLIAVGDATVVNLLKNGITPDISIVDLKIQRKQVYKKVIDLGFRDIKVFKKAVNPAGTVSYDAYHTLISLIRPIRPISKPAVMRIDGEDDLMTLLAIFLAPLNSLIVYGQPNVGLVIIKVTEAGKLQARKYLDQFVK